MRLLLVAALLAGAGWLLLSGTALTYAQEETATTYTVAPGDTLFLIAQRYGVSLETLIAVNAIANPDQIEVGQLLIIPDGASGAAALPAIDTVTVRAGPGDSVAAIAARYGQPLEQFAALNAISATTRLFPGQPLLLPRSALQPEPLRFGAVRQVQAPAQLVQGRTGRVVVATTRPLELSGAWNELPISFMPLADDPLRQFAYLPVPALIAPSTYWLTLSYVAANGLVLNQSWPIAVAEGPYNTEAITLPPDRGALLEPTLVQSETAKVSAVWSQRTPALLWSQVFSRPVDVQYRTSDPFGTRRSYNGGPVSDYHAGHDLSAPPGVPVVAPGDGMVALAEPLTVRGNAVLIDHGQGVYTGYWHLSEIKVAPGQAVKTGDLLGLVGNTGLSTGAHLHWELRIYGIAVDPMQFVEEPLALDTQ
jgi:murein DD-endopeptidase MepM/ murein hydrolase activator NlpD